MVSQTHMHITLYVDMPNFLGIITKRNFIFVIRKGILKIALDLYCLYCNLINTNFKCVNLSSLFTLSSRSIMWKKILKYTLLSLHFMSYIKHDAGSKQPTSLRNLFGHNSWSIEVRSMEIYVQIYRSKRVYKLAFGGALVFNMLLSNCVITELTELVCVKV
jgi:hypothetical protein